MFESIHPDNYLAQLQEKQEDMSQRFAEFAVPECDVFQSEPLNYRMRAEFSVWHDNDDCFYYMHDPVTKQRVRVDSFPVGSLLINRAMVELRSLILADQQLKERLFQVEFLSTLSGELLISLIYHKQLNELWQLSAKAVEEKLATLGNVYVVGRARKQKIILSQDFVTECLTVENKSYFYQQVENSFTQPNAKVNEKMLSWARQATKGSTGDLIELYCGNGNFSIALADNFDRVLATEISKSSVNSAQVNIAHNKVDNLAILRMSSEEFSQAMNGDREFRRLQGFDLSSYTYNTVLVDPPRAGLDDASVELVRRFEKIIYISCNPDTLYHNIAALHHTHKVTHFALFDQFPYTHHIECGMVLVRR